MYEKPELALVSAVMSVVLGTDDDETDSQGDPFRDESGIAYGLDD